MRKFCLVILVFVVMAGCKTKVPDEYIQPQKIRAVLYDIHIIDGYVSTISNQDSAKKVAAAYYKGFYKKFGIDSGLYARSMNYYFDHPESLGSIYKDVTARLQKSKDSIDKVQAKILKKEAALKKAKQDSINKADPKFMARQLAAKKATKDSLEKVKVVALKKAKKDSLEKVKQIAVQKAAKDKLEKAKKISLKKAKKDSVEKARLNGPKKADPAKKMN
ncbi:MAG TPA: DUF4296 domain-containing protein [Pedobacter sp.]